MAESSDEDDLCSILTPDQVAEEHAEPAPEHVDDSGAPLVKRVHGRRSAQKPTDIKPALIVLLVVIAAGLTAKVGLQASVLQKQQAQIDGLFAQLQAKPQAEPSVTAIHAAGPSSEELFRLNSECATLGKKFLEENHLKCKSAGCTENATSAGPVQGGGYQTVKGDNITDATQVSHYDPAANRCYVELTEYTINSKTSDTKLTVGFYDAQTGEKIASYGDAGSKSTDQDYWGTVSDAHHQHAFKSSLNDEEDAKGYISAKMGR
jgi:hypothetical protein